MKPTPDGAAYLGVRTTNNRVPAFGHYTDNLRGGSREGTNSKTIV